jgi:hypothetical protein
MGHCTSVSERVHGTLLIGSDLIEGEYQSKILTSVSFLKILQFDPKIEIPIMFDLISLRISKKLNSVALVRERTIPTERRPLAGEVSANFYGQRVRVVSVTDRYGLIPGFLDRSRYFFFQAAPQVYSRG